MPTCSSSTRRKASSASTARCSRPFSVSVHRRCRTHSLRGWGFCGLTTAIVSIVSVVVAGTKGHRVHATDTPPSGLSASSASSAIVERILGKDERHRRLVLRLRDDCSCHYGIREK